MLAMNFIHEIELKVRDYECDMQGIVNNANYQHYMEHARHEFLGSLGQSFAALTEEGFIMMVSKISISYKTSLHSGDHFVAKLNIERKGVKLIFYQCIYRLSDNALCTKGEVEIICTKDGKLTRGEIFDKIINFFHQKICR